MEDTKENKGGYFVYFATFSATLICTVCGASYAWSSPIIPKLNGQLPPQLNNPLPYTISTLEESWLVSLLSLGAAVGPIAAGISSDRFGRKTTLLIFACLLLASYIILAVAQNILWYFFARFIAGLGCGCALSVVPNYISEISESHNRGLLGCIMGVMLNFGSFYSFAIGPFVSLEMLSYAIMVPIILFFVVFGVFMPETPYYLVGQSEEKARAALETLRRNKSSDAIDKELMLIVKAVETSKSTKGGLLDLFKEKPLRKALTISTGLMVFQQFSGITAVLAYLQTIFDATGSSIPPEISVIIIGSVQILSTIITSQLVDRLGRRVLLLASNLGACLSLTTLGVFFHLKSLQFNLGSVFWLPILCLIVYIMSYNTGLGPIGWSIMGELFPPHVKSLACTIASVTCLLLAFLIGMFFPYLNLMLGMAGSFWLFGGCCAGGFVFSAWVVPETKGKSLMEIQEMLSSPKSKL